MRRMLLATIGFVLVLSAGQTVLAQGKDSPTLEQQRAMFEDVPRNLFGIGTIWAEWANEDWSYDARQFELIRQAGGTSTSANIPWIDVEEVQGQWYWEYVDNMARCAEQSGLELYAYMGFPPMWALPEDAQDKPFNIGYRYPPADDKEAEFVKYCKQVARRYKGKIKYYQLYNEPNGCSWINDGCSNGDSYIAYAKWMKIWYTAMKSEDPDCVLGAGALDYHSGVKEGYKWLEGLYAEGGKGYFDAFNIHPYDSQGTLHHKAIEDTRRVMVANGDGDKGIWISEYGWNTSNEDRKSGQLRKTLTELASDKYFYITMANYLSLSDPMGEGAYGLVDKKLKPRKSYLVFKETATALRLEAASKPLGRGKMKRPIGPRD